MLATQKMQNATKSLIKDLDKVQNRVDKLNKTLATLTTNTGKVEKTFHAAEKQISETGNASSGIFDQERNLDSDGI